MVRITLNGDARVLERRMTVAELLAELEIDPRRVAVERNYIIIKRDTYGTTHVENGDLIEIVNFVGGG